MRAEVLRWIRTHNLLLPGDTVTCAVSGGADSMAMLCCLISLREELGITVQAAHFNHLLRGADSDGDEEFVRCFCLDRGIPFFSGRGDAAAAAVQTGATPEEAARTLRYDFLLTCPGKIATAHTADDNCETVLMHLIRGTGLRGLCGIPVQRDRIVRPLLSVTHEDAKTYLNALSQPWREDKTNEDDFCLRNRLRHQVLPLLWEENPALAETVLRCCESLRPELAYLETEAGALLRRAQCEDGLLCSVLRNAPEPLLKRALRLSAGKDFDTHVTDRLVRAIQTGRGTCTLPDGRVLQCSCGVLCQLHDGETPAPVTLSPGETVSFGAYEITCILESCPRGHVSNREPLLRRSAVQLPLTVRCRQTGDAMATGGGTKLLKDRMIDKKLPAPLRDTLPVLVSGEEIAAVYRLEVAEKYRAVPGEPCVRIQVRRKPQE